MRHKKVFWATYLRPIPISKVLKIKALFIIKKKDRKTVRRAFFNLKKMQHLSFYQNKMINVAFIKMEQQHFSPSKRLVLQVRRLFFPYVLTYYSRKQRILSVYKQCKREFYHLLCFLLKKKTHTKKTFNWWKVKTHLAWNLIWSQVINL